MLTAGLSWRPPRRLTELRSTSRPPSSRLQVGESGRDRRCCNSRIASCPSSSRGTLTASEVTVLLPRQETRRVHADSATVVADRIAGDWRELKVALT